MDYDFASYLRDLRTIGPELILCGTILVLFLVDLWRIGRNRTISWVLAPLVTFAACYGLYLVPATTGIDVDLWPEFLGLTAVYAVVTVADLRWRGRDRWVPGAVAVIGAALACLRLWQQGVEVFGEGAAAFSWGGLVRVDAFGVLLRGLACLTLLVTSWFTIFYAPMRRDPGAKGVTEFLACLAAAAAGGMFLVATENLLFIYLSLELLSLCSYLQVGMLKGDRRSSEASLKYLIYGSVASGFMLFGFSLLYGFSGELAIPKIGQFLQTMPRHSPEGVLMTVGVLLSFSGFAYKLTLVPFHFWAPDVYEGAPTPTTAFLSVGSKAVSFGIMLRFLHMLTGDIVWAPGLVHLAALAAVVTMTYGNLAALHQSNLKRLFGYSSIAHAGYMLLGVVTVFQFMEDPATGLLREGRFFGEGYAAVLFYLGAYLLMNLGAFGAVIFLANRTGSEEIEDIRGLGWKSPWVGGAFIVFLLSLTGIPPTAGFFAKWYVFRAAIDGGFLWLAVVAGINTVISLFYYFRIGRMLFLRDGSEAFFEAPRAPWLAAVLLLLAFGTLWFGVFPGAAREVAAEAARSLGW